MKSTALQCTKPQNAPDGEFLEHRLEIFLSRLLCVKAYRIVQRWLRSGESFCCRQIRSGLPHPFTSQSFHREPVPWSQSRRGNCRPLQVALGCRPGSVRASRAGRDDPPPAECGMRCSRHCVWASRRGDQRRCPGAVCHRPVNQTG